MRLMRLRETKIGFEHDINLKLFENTLILI